MNKILFAIGHSEAFGGAQKVFSLTVKELAKKKCEVTVILPDKKLRTLLEDHNIKSYTVDFRSLKCLFVIHKILKENNFDVINTYLPKCAFIFSLINLFHRIPVYCTLLNAIIHEKQNKLQKALYPFLYFILYKISDGFIVNSEQNKQHFIETGRISCQFIKVIHSGIDPDEFRDIPKIRKIENKLILGYVGRLSCEKGPNILIQALTHLKDIDYECIIVGDGPQRNELEEYVETYNLDDKVQFLGFQSKVARLIQKMDVVIVPSLNETFGVTIIEAFALRKPVIASDVGGIPELVTHKLTGLLFPEKDFLSLAKMIAYIHNNRFEASIMGKNGYNLFEKNFTSQKMAENTLTYLNSKTKK